MDNKELLRRLALLKANPKLAETIPQAEVFKMIQDVISAFNVLKTAIDNGKIKGEAGYTPIPDVDYPSLTRYDKSIEETITALETNYAYALDAIEKKLATVKDGVDGKDAVITDADKEEIAALAYSLITLPNFDELVTSEIPRNGEAIRDALELLQGDERYKVEIADVQGLTQALNDLALIRGNTGGTIGRNQVYNFIRQAVEDGTIPAGGSGGVTDGDKGDITVSVGGTVWTIDNQAVTRQKLEHIQSGHFLARHAASTGDVQEVSPAQARTMLGLSTVATSGDYNDLSNRPDLSVFDEVEQHANLAAFPATGNVNKFYLAQDTGIMYRWTGSAYVVISSSNLGDVVGPASATDNAIARFDATTGKLIQNSVATLSDDGTAFTILPGNNNPSFSHQAGTDTPITVNFNTTGIATAPGSYRFFRNTNTSGTVSVQILQGNNTTNIQSLFAGNANSFVQALSGNFGIGDTNPAQKLSVTGNGAFTGTLTVADEAYDATTWNGSLEVPTKNAVRDELENKSNVGHTHTLANITDVTMTVANLNSLDDGVNSTLHFHASDRSRANHTGTQTASTISDFAATVIATVLTGFAVAGARTAIVATDSILVAFGKVQKYFNDLATIAFSGALSDATGTINDTQHGTRAGGTLHANATTSVAGFMSSADKTKLDGVASGANNYTHPNHTGEVTSTGDGATVLQSVAITNKTTVTPVAGDFVLISDTSDAGNLKKVDASNFLGGGGGGITEAQARAIARRYALALG